MGALGVSGSKKWLECEDRSKLAKQVMASFTSQSHSVRKRGAQSGMHHLEPISANRTRFDLPEVIFSDYYARLVWFTMREASGKIPLRALMSGRLLPKLAPAFLRKDNHYLPLAYEMINGPSWLFVSRNSGEVMLRGAPDELCNLAEAPISIRIKLHHQDGHPDIMNCKIDLACDAEVDRVTEALTERVVRKIPDLSEQLQVCVKQQLHAVYDFEKQSARAGASLCQWAEAMSSAASAAVAATHAVMQPLHVLPGNAKDEAEPETAQLALHEPELGTAQLPAECAENYPGMVEAECAETDPYMVDTDPYM